MRIVGGIYKGRIFTPGKKFSARPTTDMAKEALFNILANRYDLSEMKILDLFSGTGSIGYEFISRGAHEVTFVEKNYNHVRFIKEVILKLGITNAQVVCDDAFRFLKNYPGQFSIVFSDPPFDFPFLKDIPEVVLSSGVVHKNSLFILEHPGNYDFSKNSNFTELRKYGKVHFSFFIVS